MAQELASKAETPRAASFYYDVAYFLMSGFIHSSAATVKNQYGFRMSANWVLRLSLPPIKSECGTVLHQANMFALFAIASVDRYASLGIDDRISDIALRLGVARQSAGSSA